MLTLIEFLNGTLSLACVIISSLVGVILISKYFKYKHRTFVFIGTSWILTFSPWWAPSISFLLALNMYQGLNELEWSFIRNSLYLFVIFIWISGYFIFMGIFYALKTKDLAECGIQLKSKILLVALSFFALGLLLNIFADFDQFIIIVIAKIFLMISSIVFYLYWLPYAQMCKKVKLRQRETLVKNK